MTTLNKKITELTELTTPDANDVFVIVDLTAPSETKKIKFSNVGITLPTYETGKYLTNNGSILSWGSIDLSGYVPYTGATTNVNLGTRTLTTAHLYSSAITAGAANTNIDIRAYSNAGVRLIGDGYFTSGFYVYGTPYHISKFVYDSFADRVISYVNMALGNNLKIYLGSTLQSSIMYNGTDVIFNTRESGTGNARFTGDIVLKAGQKLIFDGD